VNVFSSGGLGEQVEKIPLWHHRDVRVRHLQPAHVGQLHHAPVVGGEPRRGELAVRHGGELLAQPQFVEQGQRRGVHRVAAEVPEEVGVLLQHGHLDPGPGQQQACHHACWAATDDHAARVLGHRNHLFSSSVE
jgi:hypothetical protein